MMYSLEHEAGCMMSARWFEGEGYHINISSKMQKRCRYANVGNHSNVRCA